MLNRYRRKLAALSAFLFAATAAVAQEPIFMWKATSPAGTAYLYGSIHLATPDMYPLDGRIEQAFQDSENLVVEVDVSKSNQTEMQALTMQLGLYTDGTTLQDHLSEEGYTSFQAFLTERQMPMQLFQAMRAWTAAATLQVLEMQRLGFDMDLGIEKHFLRLAESQGQIVHELESAEFQLRMLAEMPEELQELFLISTIEEYDTVTERIDDMVGFWRTGDAAALEEMLLEDYFEKPEMQPLYERILLDRNVGMALTVQDMLEGGGTWFVIAGAAHMVGERGVPDLVRQAGFEVVQVGVE